MGLTITPFRELFATQLIPAELLKLIKAANETNFVIMHKVNNEPQF